MAKLTRRDYWELLKDRIKYKKKALAIANKNGVDVFESANYVNIYVFIKEDIDFIMLKSYEDLIKLLKAMETFDGKDNFLFYYYQNKGAL